MGMKTVWSVLALLVGLIVAAALFMWSGVFNVAGPRYGVRAGKPNPHFLDRDDLPDKVQGLQEEVFGWHPL